MNRTVDSVSIAVYNTYARFPASIISFLWHDSAILGRERMHQTQGKIPSLSLFLVEQRGR